MKQNTSIIPAITDKTTLEACVDKVAQLEVHARQLIARRDEEINRVREKHDTQIESVKAHIKAHMAIIETFVTAHRDELFGPRSKSATSSLATYGLALGNPVLKTLNRKWTWEKVLTNLQERGLAQFVRTLIEVDKEALKSADLPEVQLAELGLRIDQTESVYVDPKNETAGRIKA